jgi:predicted Zn-dependent peptidase
MKRARTILFWLCVLGVAAPGVRAQTAPGTPAAPSEASARPPELHLITQELPNGLQIVMVEDHDAPVINLQVWYHVGSKDERPGRTGFAHLFEHLMFKGSAHVPAEQHIWNVWNGLRPIAWAASTWMTQTSLRSAKW